MIVWTCMIMIMTLEHCTICIYLELTEFFGHFGRRILGPCQISMMELFCGNS